MDQYNDFCLCWTHIEAFCFQFSIFLEDLRNLEDYLLHEVQHDTAFKDDEIKMHMCSSLILVLEGDNIIRCQSNHAQHFTWPKFPSGKCNKE